MKWIIYAITCIAAGLIPLLGADPAPRTSRSTHEFLETFHGARMSQVELTKQEADFYAGFPGATGYFALDGCPGESVFLRYTEKPTRMLHSAEGCYKASGYELQHADNVSVRIDELSDSAWQWSQFSFVENEQRFLVRQCIVSHATGETYADVPAWYWQTTFSSQDPGPWLAVTWKLPDANRADR